MDLGKWLGANLLEKYTASLLVYGAESSDEYEFEKSFDGCLSDCLEKLREYQEIIHDNKLDAYLTLESWRSNEYFEGDFANIMSRLMDCGYVEEVDVCI